MEKKIYTTPVVTVEKIGDTQLLCNSQETGGSHEKYEFTDWI